jgi:hypothetical protein
MMIIVIAAREACGEINRHECTNKHD